MGSKNGQDAEIRELRKELSYYKKEYTRLKNEEARSVELAIRLDDAYKQLEDLVVTDHLTKIGNRRMFETRLLQGINDAERGRPLALLLVDVDNFKPFNDNWGHQEGDLALVQVVNTMIGIVRKIDCLTRYGGDEFALISFVDEAGSPVLADKICTAVANIKNANRNLTVSIGITHYSEGDTIESIFARSDLALYRSKKAGRNNYEMFLKFKSGTQASPVG